MKKVSATKEAAILAQLHTDIKKDLKNATDLNTAAIKKIYKAENCVQCGEVVSMLSEKGLCGYCEHTRKYLSALGKKGGAAGTGESKKRGDSEHYKKMRAVREAKRVDKKCK
jgi:hypothetical protein